jgi:hypothetical protein
MWIPDFEGELFIDAREAMLNSGITAQYHAAKHALRITQRGE